MSYSDMALLGAEPGFVARVTAALRQAAVGIQSQAITPTTAAYHYKLVQFAASILSNPTSYGQLFAGSIATDSAVIADATANGTIALTPGNVAVQGQLVTDAHITSAIAAHAGAYFSSI